MPVEKDVEAAQMSRLQIYQMDVTELGAISSSIPVGALVAG